jgi:hypothetical protein
VTSSAPKSAWAAAGSPDPTRPLLERFRRQPARAAAGFVPTALGRGAYLELIAGGLGFWKTHQDPSGAIIDPYRREEYQYSTPAFAHAAAALVVWGRRRDLLEPAAQAMDWAVRTLSQRQAATAHEDFYAPMLAHAWRLLRPLVAPERAERWAAEIRGFDPFQTYRALPGGGNWNVVALAGEALFARLKLRAPGHPFVERSLAAQATAFSSPHGLYLEGPMAYDHFPRLWAADLLAQGYDGPCRAELAETLRRGAITSLFLQSPWGELPAGGRSAHHQWNEAEQCVTYEIHAAQAARGGDVELAAIFKRAAHLALASMRRWVRPSGEMQILKNWVDPAQNHGFETYSAHSQYNLLPMAMLALAYEHAAATESVAERPAPADGGGYVLVLPELHKIVANAGGTYIEIDPCADHHYDATGLIRVHARGVSPQLGPSDSILPHPAYHCPEGSAATVPTAIGAAWLDGNGAWRRLGELDAANIERWQVGRLCEEPHRVCFDVTYEGKLGGVTRIVEHYVVTPDGVELSTRIEGYTGPLRYVWPVLADDGRTVSDIAVINGAVTVSQDGGKTGQIFTPIGAATVRVEAGRYANHNGWARLAIAEYPGGGEIRLRIAPSIFRL